VADTLLPDFERAGDDRSFLEVAANKALILLEINGSAGHVAEEALQAARRTGEAFLLVLAQAIAALQCLALGRREQAEALLRELSENTRIAQQSQTAVREAVRCAVCIGDIELARGFVTQMEATPTAIPLNQHSLLTARAVLAQAEGDHSTAVALFTEAAHRWDRFGNRLEHAHALLGLGKSLLAAGRKDDGTSRLREALDRFTAMGADHRVQQCRELLQAGITSDPRTA
jgi:tetratricopeptide (TPR) repeat protein